MSEPTIFDKIINQEIPAVIVFEDEDILAFRDNDPQAPIHIIIIPKKKNGLLGPSYATEEHQQILGKLLLSASQIAKKEQIQKGYRIVINEGEHGCQSVKHIHVHLLGGRKLGWPPG